MKKKRLAKKSPYVAFVNWGRLGGLARKKALTIAQRRTIAVNAGIASGLARKKRVA